jgi:phage terminase small subunit
MAGLTRKQRVFIEEYLTLWNATEAARRAGYSHPKPVGSRMLAHPVVDAAIQAEIARRAMGADEVLKRLSDQARLNISELMTRRERPVYNSEGDYVGVEYIYEPNWEAIQAQGHLVKSIVNTPSGPKIEFYDAQKALELLGKKLGLWRELFEHTGRDSGPIQFIEIVRDDSDAPTD